MSNLYKKEIEGLVETISSMTPRHGVSFRLENKKMHSKVAVHTMGEKNLAEYDLVKDLYVDFANSLQDYLDSPKTKVAQELTERKKQFLYNKLFPYRSEVTPWQPGANPWTDHPWTVKLIKANPEIVFVQDKIAAQNLLLQPDFCIMTSETQVETYLSLYEEVLEILVKKGYCDEEEAKKKVMTLADTEQGKNTLLRFADTNSKYDELLQDLFKKRLVKEYCKQIPQNNFFPVKYDPTS
jgi:hypothetical protein